MFHPFKAYRRSQEIQLEWIRNNPVKYVAINAALLAVYFGYIEYQDRKFKRELNEASRKVPYIQS